MSKVAQVKKSPVEIYVKKYNLKPEHYTKASDSDRIVILKSGINQIKEKAKISITIKDFKLGQSAPSRTGESQESVYLVGQGVILNDIGHPSSSIESTASATPSNCDFNFKLETAEARLNARIVLLLTKAPSMFLGEAELKSSASSKNDIPSKTDDELPDFLKSTMDQMSKSDRS